MKKVKVAELRPGMAFDQPVYIDPTNVLVQAKQELSAKDIDRLTKWGIKEVETNGAVIRATPPPEIVPEAPEASAPARSGGIPDAEKVKIHTDYETMRKNKITFRTLIKETSELLKTNNAALIDGKAFDNHAILNSAARLAEELSGKRYILLALYGIKMNVNWSVFHAIHAACYGTLLGIAMGYTRPKLQELIFSMLLMDCGMEKLPSHIREKNSALTEQELTPIKKHPLLGYQLLTRVGKVKASLATVALQHHETFDGSGYPQGLKANQSEEAARIAAIADTYTAMIEKRPQRAAFLPYDAMKHILSVQMNRFDPKLLRTFLGQLSIYPFGSLVELSGKQIGLVVSCRPDKPLRPLLRLLRDENGLPYGGLNFMDLTLETDIYIVRALDAETAGLELESEI